MEVVEILEQARQTEPPRGWIVFPLLRQKVQLGIVGWIFGLIIGFGLFIPIALAVIPGNYQHGVGAAIITTILLAIPLFVGVGSLWSLITDIRRLMQSQKHLIVITPENFVKQEGDKIIQVPLEHVLHVTARGKPLPEASTGGNAIEEIPSAGENTSGFILGRGLVPSGMKIRKRRMRTPTSLAFIDGRTDEEVLVVSDEAYGDPNAIANLLKEYARHH